MRSGEEQVDICPSCLRQTPEDRKVCPYCPWDVVKWQLLGTIGAYVLAFTPVTVVVILAWMWGKP